MKTQLVALLSSLAPWTMGAAASNTSRALAVCDEIHAAAPNHLAYAPSSPRADLNSPEFNELFHNASTTYWNAINDADIPACALFPSCADEVSAAVAALRNEPAVPFALKSGGHNWNPEFSSTNGGVLISFRPYLQSTTLTPDRRSAKIGPGSRWSESMQKLDKSNKCVVGGRAGDVGVGGYLLQGGISYLSAQYVSSR